MNTITTFPPAFLFIFGVVSTDSMPNISTDARADVVVMQTHPANQWAFYITIFFIVSPMISGFIQPVT